MHDLRKILSEYHSVLVSYEPADYRKVSELGTQLDLMLNLEEAEQRALWEVADRLFKTRDKDKRIAARRVAAQIARLPTLLRIEKGIDQGEA